MTSDIEKLNKPWKREYMRALLEQVIELHAGNLTVDEFLQWLDADVEARLAALRRRPDDEA